MSACIWDLFFFSLWLETLYYHVENEIKLNNSKFLVEIK